MRNQQVSGASPLATGLAGADAPEPPSRLGPTDGIPSAERELWRAGCADYPDLVWATPSGDIGMKADFGRPVVRSIGQWCYLATEVERLSAGYAAFPRDVAVVMNRMGDGESVPSAADISSDTGVAEKRVKEIHRALKTLGLARFGVLCDGDADAYVARGSGYWLSRTGDDLSTGLHASGIEAATAGETVQHGSTEGESPTVATSDGDAPKS